jgi:hypothetical protein
MQTASLTLKQKRLIKELREFSSLFSLDYYNIEQYPKDTRTTYLELAKDKLIRVQVIMWYTLVDEFLNIELSHYFFGRSRSFLYLWRTKRFQNFNHYFLEELSLLQKLRFVRSIIKVPKNIIADIERLNSLRNGLAHSFFPQNLRKSQPIWKGKDIFSLEGVALFEEDMDKVDGFFFKRL